MTEWHPHAIRIPGRTAGLHAGGGRKIVWHTTEGHSASGAIAEYRAHGGWPTFTFEYLVNGRSRVYQHMPISQAARALRHPSGPETNRANAVQVEIVGFARDAPTWPHDKYRAIARLARWIEHAWDVPRRTTVRFGTPAHRMSGMEFFRYAGHCGHEHVPHNDHYDPGALRINLVLNSVGGIVLWRLLEPGDVGTEVLVLQRALNRRLHARGRAGIAEDGIFGPRTGAALREVTYLLGFPRSVVESGVALPRAQELIARPDSRPPAFLARARRRRRADKRRAV
jgi:hypothetical protein